MLKHIKGMSWLGLLIALVAFTAMACSSDTETIVKEVEVPGETVIVEKEVIKEVQVPGETIVKTETVVKTVEVPVVVEKEVVKTVEVEKIVVVDKAEDKVLRMNAWKRTPTHWSPTTWDPPWWQQHYMFSRLIVPDDIAMEFRGDVAESWTVNDDSTSYTFKIRENMLWHDGRPVTAHDVAFSYKAHLVKENTSAHRGDIMAIKGAQDFYDSGKTSADDVPGIVVEDDYTIRFDMEYPNTLFLMHSVNYFLFIVPVHIMGQIPDGEWATHPSLQGNVIGSGPFKLTKTIPDQRYEVEAFDDYYLGRPKIDRIEFIVIPSKDALFVAMQRGDIDVATTFGFPTEMVQSFIDDPRFAVRAVSGTTVRGFVVNQRVEALQDPRIRQAFLYALDRKALINAFWDKNGVIKNSLFFHSWYADPAWDDLYPYNPDKARELLAEAGWDSDYEIESITYYTQQRHQDFGAAVQQQLSEVGMKFKWVALENAAWEQRWSVDGDWEWAFIGAGGSHPLSMLETGYSEGSANIYGVANPELQAQIDAAKLAKTLPEQIKIYRAIGEEFATQLYSLPILMQTPRIFANVKWYHPVLSRVEGASIMEEIPVIPTFVGPENWMGYHPQEMDVLAD